MRIASWNVNSIRAREERALAWLQKHSPDVLCLQETKVVDSLFPSKIFEDIGYRVVWHGQKAYNGVAILARSDPQEVLHGFSGDVDSAGARLISARIGSVWVYSCYVPNGRVMGSEFADMKIDWLARLKSLLEKRHSASDHLVVCGDFNIATDDRDVYDPERWKTQVLYHPTMRKTLAQFTGDTLVDTFRLHHSEGEKFSWWDYRQLGFPKNRGLRIDYVYASKELSEKCVGAEIDRDERKGKSPSDHAPVWADFEVES